MEEVRKNSPQPSAHVRHSPEHSIIPLGRRPQVRDFLLVFAGLVFEFVESEVFDFLVAGGVRLAFVGRGRDSLCMEEEGYWCNGTYVVAGSVPADSYLLADFHV
jgi:hypothetical protein